MVWPGLTATMVVCASDMPAMPAMVSPMPAWAIAPPHTDSGRPARRDRLLARGTWNRRMRWMISAKLPRISQVAAAKARAAEPAR